MLFTVYYRGFCIERISAKNVNAAKRAYAKMYDIGKLGTTVFIEECSSVEEHKKAIEMSKVVPA